MARIEVKVTLTGEYSFMRRAFNGFQDEEVTIYKMIDDEGKIYVWKTTGLLKMETILDNNDVDTYFPKKNDVFVIRATVKGEGEYKGEPQTEINRVKVIEIVSKYEAVEKARVEKQKQSVDLQAGDQIVEMSYRSYKQHYADCETVEGSYDDEFRIIRVIVRTGRMKASGVRGEHFKGYELVNENNERITYRAVCEDNALKRAQKNYPNHTWECVHVYDYRAVHRIW